MDLQDLWRRSWITALRGARLGAGIATVVLCLGGTSGQAPAADWLRAGLNTEQPQWGPRAGLQFSVPAEKSHWRDGPRGLIRIWSPVLADGGYDLVNFIAVEPVVHGRRAYSELELSQADGVRGKRIWPAEKPSDTSGRLESGKLIAPSPGVEQLEVTLRVERFENGAHVYLVATQRSDASDEIGLTIHAEPDTAPLDYCILTATMGNKIRARLLWLKDEVVGSRTLYADHRGGDFAPHRVFGLDRLHRAADGGVLAALTTDEADPAKVFPFPGTLFWYYGGVKVTQYWRRPGDAAGADVKVAVNGRCTYWLTDQAIPGGVAFENFELRERFRENQQFVFGVTRRTPRELGFADRSGR